MNSYDVITLPNEEVICFSVPGAPKAKKIRNRNLETIFFSSISIFLLYFGLWFVI